MSPSYLTDVNYPPFPQQKAAADRENRLPYYLVEPQDVLEPDRSGIIVFLALRGSQRGTPQMLFPTY
ncbi:hypothetical protein [Paenibacillus xylanilyticus]|uniref:hypothetical protein n=1 Tax=Paenibacillus xylanilyticus TaxID=248903 RepID=UPI001FE83314|nr:hypothetical protein [Paenibacillus xylanilyticus]